METTIVGLKRITRIAVWLLVVLASCSGCANKPTQQEILDSSRPILSHTGNRIPFGSKNVYLLGVNYPWYAYGYDFGGVPGLKPRDWQIIASDFAKMHSQGATVVRWYVFGDGRCEPKFGPGGRVTGLGPQFFNDIDRALAIAAQNHMMLLLSINDSLMFVATGTGASQGGHANILLTEGIQQTYMQKAFMPLVQHLAASPYKNCIAGIEIISEPEVCTSGFYSTGGVNLGIMKAFIVNAADYVHTYGNGLYATVGSAAPYWVDTWKGLGLDYYCVHYYKNMDSHDLLAGTLSPGNALVDFSSLNLDRPCVVEEFQTAIGNYSLDDQSPGSALWTMNLPENRGYAGALAWSFRNHDVPSNWDAFAPAFLKWRTSHAASLTFDVSSSE